MGRDYTPKRRGADFSVNHAGASLLGALHGRFSMDCLPPRFDDDPPCTPFKMDTLQARANGNRLALVSITELDTMYEELKLYPEWFAGSKEDFCSWVRSWQRFLQECGGYEVIT